MREVVMVFFLGPGRGYTGICFVIIYFVTIIYLIPAWALYFLIKELK